MATKKKMIDDICKIFGERNREHLETCPKKQIEILHKDREDIEALVIRFHPEIKRKITILISTKRKKDTNEVPSFFDSSFMDDMFDLSRGRTVEIEQTKDKKEDFKLSDIIDVM